MEQEYKIYETVQNIAERERLEAEVQDAVADLIEYADKKAKEAKELREENVRLRREIGKLLWDNELLRRKANRETCAAVQDGDDPRV